MRKSVVAFLLAVVTVLPACQFPMGGYGFGSQSESVSEGGSYSSGNVDGWTGGDSSLGESSLSSVGTSSSENNSSSESNSSGDSSSSGGGNGDVNCQRHVDDNGDGNCDGCKESVLVTLDFFALNDLHGKFEDTDAQPGVDELSTYVKTAQANNPYTFVLSSGDMWQGGTESNLTYGAIMTEWMNEMQFTSMTLGNHEYDWGEEKIQANLELANFPFLAINVYDSADNQRVDYCDASVVVERNGVKIGIIGAMGDCYSSISADKVEDVYFKTGSQLTALVKAEATRLRQDERVDFVVYSVHDDYAEYDASLSNGYVDLVFEGHSHSDYARRDSYGVYHLQNGGDNEGISRAKVTFNTVNRTSSVASAQVVYTSQYTHLADDPVVDELLSKYADQIAKATEVLGQNEILRKSTDILNTCAKLYYEAGVKKWGNEYDIVCAGGYMNTRSPYEIAAGEVKYGDLISVLPFDNPLVLCKIRGSDLQARFITQQSKYYNYFSDSFDKSGVVSDKIYYVVVDTYSSQYAPNNLTEVEVYDENIFARDLLAEHIKGGNWAKSSLTTIPQILAVGAGLGDNASSENTYSVRGTISSIENTTNGRFYIEDDAGNSLYIYNANDAEGNKFGAMTNPPKVGDTVLIVGKVYRYVNRNGAVTIEMKDVTVKEVA